MDEPALLERARAGDDTAFEELLAPYPRAASRHCYRLLASAHDADDALQEAPPGAQGERRLCSAELSDVGQLHR